MKAAPCYGCTDLNHREVLRMDLIERGEALRLIAEEQARSKYGMEDCALYRASKIVKELPAVDAVPVRHEHWIERGGIFACSGCGAEDGVMTQFCSSCGAKMDGDAE